MKLLLVVCAVTLASLGVSGRRNTKGRHRIQPAKTLEELFEGICLDYSLGYLKLSMHDLYVVHAFYKIMSTCDYSKLEFEIHHGKKHMKGQANEKRVKNLCYGVKRDAKRGTLATSLTKVQKPCEDFLQKLEEAVERQNKGTL